jgi:hypothetical protein
VVNDVEIKVSEVALWLRCDGLDRVGAGKLAFMLQYWALWGVLPREDEVVEGAILPEDLN